jgi:hypothetical protein
MKIYVKWVLKLQLGPAIVRVQVEDDQKISPLGLVGRVGLSPGRGKSTLSWAGAKKVLLPGDLPHGG